MFRAPFFHRAHRKANIIGKRGGAFLVLLVSLFSAQAQESAPPANPFHHVSSEVVIEHFVVLPKGTHPSLLNVLDQYDLIPMRDSSVIHEYADADGNTWRVLLHQPDANTHEWMRKRARTVISAVGVCSYTAQGATVHVSPRIRNAGTDAEDAQRRTDVQRVGIGSDFDFMPRPNEEGFAAMRNAGADVSWLPNGNLMWRFGGGDTEETDFDHLKTERIYTRPDGVVMTTTTRYRYAPTLGEYRVDARRFDGRDYSTCA